jgi:hypothetical protein
MICQEAEESMGSIIYSSSSNRIHKKKTENLMSGRGAGE